MRGMKRKVSYCVKARVTTALAVVCAVGCAVSVSKASAADEILSWKGRSVVFLGDSITDKSHVGCKTNYWGFLAERMGFSAHVYGKNGWQSDGIPKQVAWAYADLGEDVDAVFMLIGTNDYNAGVPLGET